MNRCEEVSDRMAEVAGGDRWSAEELEHLASCPDCAGESSIVGRAARLGSRLPPLDGDRIASRVRHRLRSEPRPTDRQPLRFRTPRRWALGLAAAAALFLAVRAGLDPNTATNSPTVGVLTELDALTGSELETLLDAIVTDDPPVPGDGPGLGDLSDDELQRLLESWERS